MVDAMPLQVTEEEFDQCVAEALDSIPEQLTKLVDNCVVIVEDEPPHCEDLYGYYDGVPLTERGHDYSGVLPDRIVLFREPHVHEADDMDELVDEIHTTVVHEIAHHFGIDDARLHELGYD